MLIFPKILYKSPSKLLISRKILFNFSYNFPKIPKTKLNPPDSFSFEHFFTKFFLSQQMDSLSKELFEYLINSKELKANFPILSENKEIYINFMIFHVYLLQKRISKENSHFSQKEAEKLIFQYKSKYFIQFAEILNDFVPVQDFSSYYSENYTTRYLLIEKALDTLHLESQNAHFSQEEEEAEMKKLIRKFIFYNKFPLKHAYIKKTLIYYKAHCNYLDSLKYSEIVEEKIYWGFLDQKLLEGKDPEFEGKNP